LAFCVLNPTVLPFLKSGNGRVFGPKTYLCFIMTEELEDDALLDNHDADSDELYEHYRIVIDKKQSLLRIDKFLMDRLPHATRTKIQNAIEAHTILVNNQAIKASYKVKPLDIITVTLPDPPRDTEVIPEDIPLTFVYEDD
jgi:ribosomal 50S subunit-recycling heat shock protein